MYSGIVLLIMLFFTVVNFPIVAQTVFSPQGLISLLFLGVGEMFFNLTPIDRLKEKKAKEAIEEKKLIEQTMLKKEKPESEKPKDKKSDDKEFEYVEVDSDYKLKSGEAYA